MSLILFFLIVEPHGLARLWQIGKQKLRVWPFPYWMTARPRMGDGVKREEECGSSADITGGNATSIAYIGSLGWRAPSLLDAGTALS